jgi:hypothetical protein
MAFTKGKTSKPAKAGGKGMNMMTGKPKGAKMTPADMKNMKSKKKGK